MEKKHLDDMFTLQFYLNIVAYTVQCNVELKELKQFKNICVISII